MLMGLGGHRLSGLAEAHGGGLSLQSAMWFDGVDDYVTITNAAAISPTFSLLWRAYVHDVLSLRYPILWNTSFWRTLDGGGQYVLQKAAGGSFSASLLFNPYAIVTYGLIASLNSPTLTVGRYINGAFTSAAYTYETLAGEGSLSTITIGRRSPSYFFGVIRDVALYNRTLTAGEITDYHAGTISQAGLLLHLVGDGIADANWIDDSGNGKNGIVSGSPEICYIRSDGKIIKGGVVMNP